MQLYPGYNPFSIPFRAKKLIYLVILMALIGAAFLFGVEVYVATHKHKQPPVRSPHGHANSTPRSSMDPGASPSR